MWNRLDLLINLETSLKIKLLSSQVRFWLPLVNKERLIYIPNRFTQINKYFLISVYLLHSKKKWTVAGHPPVCATFVFQSITQVPLKQILLNLYTISVTITSSLSLIVDFSTFFCFGVIPLDLFQLYYSSPIKQIIWNLYTF
jgi:hypothetical protein